jgi:hypothetical protein
MIYHLCWRLLGTAAITIMITPAVSLHNTQLAMEEGRICEQRFFRMPACFHTLFSSFRILNCVFLMMT